MPQFVLPESGADIPAWFGKLPGMGDFAQRRLAPEFLEPWDGWLQRGLQQLRSEQTDWLAHYLDAPLWYFALGQGVVGAKPWLGVVMPSVDAVGRYFPLTLAIELIATDADASEQSFLDIARWWGRSADTALQALEQDWDSVLFDQALQAAFSQVADALALGPMIEALPDAHQSCWYANLGQANQVAYSLPSLPLASAFNMLFGFADTPAVQG
jgi:type VI secretion system protein ImpM